MRYKEKILLSLGVAAYIGLTAASSWAVINGVSKTVHNLGSGTQGPFSSSDTTEVCVFCHTPHNAVSGKKFLWNRYDSAVTFNLYTASSTLNFVKSITISDVSKMCMSCHDGVTALNSMANPAPVPTMSGEDEIGDMWPTFGEFGPNIGEGGTGEIGLDQTAGGGNLTNDHPISFLYSQSEADPTIKPRSGNFVGGLPLWDGKVECVTCHDPHINYGFPNGRRNPGVTDPAGDTRLTPFLRKSNSSSSLCFTCHDK